MRQQALLINLRGDCVFSASTATEGGHESLDRVPGSALLGVAAADLYQQLSREDAWLAFHSGKIRFTDGLPWNGSNQGYPMPYAWHHKKTESADKDGALQAERLYNLLAVDHIDDAEGGRIQPKQLRSGYVHIDGAWTKPAHRLRLKTAIDSATGRAAEGQLFGYDALARGQQFVCFVEADDDTDSELFERVIQSLQGERWLGRSRSAEYGRVRISSLDAQQPQPGEVKSGRLTLWALSDLALCDEQGLPTLIPDAGALGLQQARLDTRRSFLRHRRYSPWNAARHGYERERMVLEAGSVLCFDLNQTPTAETLERLQQGVGLYREAGLGRLWVNPPLLADEHPAFNARQQVHAATLPERPDHPLLDWLEDQDDDWKMDADQRAQQLAEAYRMAISRARKAAGVDQGVNFGPSKSQWGRILEVARRRQGQNLFNELFHGDAAVVKETAEGWNIDIPPEQGNSWRKLAVWMREQLAVDNSSPREYAHKLRRLAHRVRDDIERRSVKHES